jgi:hypothetical protein
VIFYIRTTLACPTRFQKSLKNNQINIAHVLSHAVFTIRKILFPVTSEKTRYVRIKAKEAAPMRKIAMARKGTRNTQHRESVGTDG